MNDSEILIGQYYGTSLTSRLIRWRTWSDVSHTSAFLPGGEEVIEAWGGGVARRSWREGHTLGTKIAVYRVPCTIDQRREFYDFMHAQIGKRYDYTGILGFITRARSECKEKWFCSEVVFAAAEKAGVRLLCRIAPHQVAPGTLDTSPVLQLVGERIV